MTSPARSSSPPPAPRRRGALAWILGLLLKITLTAITLAVPLLGVWVASSLAVYHNGPVWLAVVAGSLMALGLPLAWDRWREARRKKRKDADADRVLTTFDRLVARTFVLNLLFLVTILFAFPRAGFSAISTRGDWMLGDARGGVADTARAVLFDVAGGLEWLYVSSTDNPYADDTGVAATDDVRPAPTPTATPGAAASTYRLGASAHTWPLPAEPHPVVRDLLSAPPDSIAAVAKHIKARVADPFLRVKALHDFAAEWLAYDAAALEAGAIPSQDAAHVFAARKAVCAGYARLLVALGEHTGDRVVYVTGHSRSSGEDLDGVGHAWNAVEIDGAWYLIDATWDAGFVNGGKFTRKYGTDYLFTPPEVFGLDHLPDDAAWQLREAPLSRGEFLRQPAMSPRFFSRGLSLVSPKRSQVDTAGGLEVVVDNPRQSYVMAVAVDKSSGDKTRCGAPANTNRLTVRCALPDGGRYQVQLFANDAEHGTFESIGYLEANNGA